MKWLFWSKPKSLFVLIHQYLTLFHYLGQIMLNYLFCLALFWFISGFKSPVFWVVSIHFRIQTKDLIQTWIKSQKVVFTQALFSNLSLYAEIFLKKWLMSRILALVNLNIFYGCHTKGMDLKYMMNNMIHISILSGTQDYFYVH